MGSIENFSLTTTYNFLIIVLCIILLAAYSFYIYRYTLPSISNFNRYFLVALRAVTVALIFFLIFEPLLTITKKEKVDTKNYIFIDNSKSITVKDSSARADLIKNFVSKLSGENNFVINTFGNEIRELKSNTADSLLFNDPNTNISQIFSFMKEKENINSAVLISDGIITEGNDPAYLADKLNFPVFTIGAGDTTISPDVNVKDIVYNQYIYKEKPTEIEAIITNYFMENKRAVVSLFEDDKLITTENIVITNNGINKVKFNYTPNQSGEKKITVSISPFPGEENKINNRKSVFINVLENKIKIALIAGAPSPDLSAIHQSLVTNKDFDIKNIVQVAQNKFWENENLNIIDSANVLFLIGFPSPSISNRTLVKVAESIQKGKPFFIQVTSSTDLRRLKNLEAVLPFSTGQMINDYIQAQPDPVSGSFSSAFSRVVDQYKLWSNLPPIERSMSVITAKPESQILVRSKVRNVPVTAPILLSRSIANTRSIALIGDGIWRWKLSTAEKNPDFFPNLVNDIVKWLNNAKMQKQFFVRTDKKIYSLGEQIEFTAELYDQTFNPVDSANIKLILTGRQNQKTEISFSKVRDGIYQSLYNAESLGDYSFNADATFNGTLLKSNTGKFNVTESEIEKLDTRMNINLLKQIANQSGGKYYPLGNSSQSIDEIKKSIPNFKKDKLSYSETEIWSNEWIMIIIISLFAIEWFIRKRIGML
ncbi:MAG: hypothetical protein AB1521_14170 [Bacteroidota bacterium]